MPPYALERDVKVDTHPQLSHASSEGGAPAVLRVVERCQVIRLKRRGTHAGSASVCRVVQGLIHARSRI
jgi:hypothetical protein